MIGPENLAGAYFPGAITQSGIAGDRSTFTDVGDRGGRLQRAVAVNDEARIALLDEHRIERICQKRTKAGDADVPSDVTLTVPLGDAQPA